MKKIWVEVISSRENVEEFTNRIRGLNKVKTINLLSVSESYSTCGVGPLGIRVCLELEFKNINDLLAVVN